MSIIRRDDGVVFVLQPDRMMLGCNNTSQLRKEIRTLCDSYGSNLRLFQHRRDQYEAVLSKDSGYLLGEIVWQHFEKVPNLIYCEISDKTKREAIVVIVRDGKIYLDTKIMLDQLKEKINHLMSDNAHRYVVYIYGDVPFDFVQPAVKTLAKLPHSLFKQLKADERFKLLQTPKALDEFHFNSHNKSYIIIATIIGALLLANLWWYARLQATPVVINPYEQYSAALQTPRPGEQIAALLYGLNSLNANSGWFTDSFDYNSGLVQVVMRSLGGSASLLVSNAEAHGVNVNFSGSGAIAKFALSLSDRASPSHIANTEQIIALIMDRMTQILPYQAVEVQTTEDHQVFEKTNLTIVLYKVAPDILQLIATNLDDLPVSVTRCKATIKNGLITGSLQLSVMGK